MGKRATARGVLLALVGTAVVVATAGSPSVAPAQATSPASRPARPPTGRDAVLQPAVAELVKEIQASLKSGEPPPRLQSNYFDEHPVEGATPEAVIAAIARQQAKNGDVRVGAYVQWQLLSALPEEPDAKTAGALLALYRAAPRPAVRPGLEQQDRQRLDRLVRQAGQERESELSTKLTEAVERVETDNRHVLAYRDELFMRLPPTYETFVAALEDAVVRLETGADAEAHTEAVVEAIREWASEPRSQAELREMNRLVLKVKNQQGPEYFYSAEWRPSAKRLEWRKRRDNLNAGQQLDELAEFLYQQANPSSTSRRQQQ